MEEGKAGIAAEEIKQDNRPITHLNKIFDKLAQFPVTDHLCR